MNNLVQREPTPISTKSNEFVLSLYPRSVKNTTEFSRLPHRALGDYGEQLAKAKFECAGYSIKYAATGSKCGDLRVFCKGHGRGWSRIEVKTAQCGKNGTYRFCLSKGKHTNHCHSDYVLIIAIDKYDNEYFYLIPSFAIADITYITISNPITYEGIYKKYQQHGQLSLTASLEIALL